LRHLYLKNTAVTMATLRELPQLEDLALSGPNITDQTLVDLGQRPSLTGLTIQDTAVTYAGFIAFQDLNPQCWVQGRPYSEEELAES